MYSELFIGVATLIVSGIAHVVCTVTQAFIHKLSHVICIGIEAIYTYVVYMYIYKMINNSILYVWLHSYFCYPKVKAIKIPVTFCSSLSSAIEHSDSP